MRVHVDEAGKTGVAGQLEYRDVSALRIAARRLFLEGLDLAVTDQHEYVLLHRVGLAVDEPATTQRDGSAVGRERHLPNGEPVGFVVARERAESEGQREQQEDGAGHARGMNSWLSKSGSFMRPARQSALAWSMRSFDEDTKFQSMNRSPTGSPPSAITVARAVAVMVLSSPLSKTSILPAPKAWPRTSISPAATYSARSEKSSGSAVLAPVLISQCA